MGHPEVQRAQMFASAEPIDRQTAEETLIRTSRAPVVMVPFALLRRADAIANTDTGVVAPRNAVGVRARRSQS